jgi:hypothetical protein
MGLFGSLLGRKPDPRETLIRALAALRIRSDPAARVMGYDESMLGALGREQIFMLPEASLVVMVEMFATLCQQGVAPVPAISAIDQHRAQSTGPLSAPLPSDLFDYIPARIQQDHPQGGRLDESFVDNAIHTAAAVYGLDLEMPKRAPYLERARFEVGPFEVVLASYTRRDGGYLFPYRLIACDRQTRAFAFSYNLEVTPVSCCLGAHQSDGSHRTLGEADPEMTQVQFEAWAYPLLLQRIYADRVMSADELLAFALEWLERKLVADGYRVTGVDEALDDAQIYGFDPDGVSVTILVRVGTFPIAPSAKDFGDDIDAWHDEDTTEDRLYFAGVMLGNALANNDVERRAVLRDTPVSVWFDGLKPC